MVELYSLHPLSIYKKLHKEYLKYRHYKYAIYKPNKKSLDKTVSKKLSKKNKSAILFASGPSVNKLNFKKVQTLAKDKDMDIFMVNTIPGSELKNYFNPNYYIASDPHLLSLFGNPGIIHENNIYNICIKNIVSDQCKVFVPLGTKISGINEDRLHYFNNCELLGSYNTFDITKPRNYTGNTAYISLAVACYLGYKKIYIIGYDIDFFLGIKVDSHNNLYHKSIHFYTDRTNEYGPCVPVGQSFGSTMDEYIYLMYKMFKSLRRFSNYNSIINLDPNGLVTAFSKEHDLDIYR